MAAGGCACLRRTWRSRSIARTQPGGKPDNRLKRDPIVRTACDTPDRVGRSIRGWGVGQLASPEVGWKKSHDDEKEV